MSKEDKAYIVQLVKQIIHPYFAEAIADILIAHGVTFKVEPQTNADHIRCMTDEKLAELFAGMCQSNADGESRCYACLFNAWCPACGYTDDWLEWLQQPYKENEDER